MNKKIHLNRKLRIFENENLWIKSNQIKSANYLEGEREKEREVKHKHTTLDRNTSLDTNWPKQEHKVSINACVRAFMISSRWEVSLSARTIFVAYMWRFLSLYSLSFAHFSFYLFFFVLKLVQCTLITLRPLYSRVFTYAFIQEKYRVIMLIKTYRHKNIETKYYIKWKKIFKLMQSDNQS